MLRVALLLAALALASVYGAELFRLSYFPVKGGGRAEKIRLLFRLANKTEALRDNVITSASWSSLKDKTPFGQLPILRHGKLRLAQSVAILQYVARELNLAPSVYSHAANSEALSFALAADDLTAAWSKAQAAGDRAGFRATWDSWARRVDARLGQPGSVDYLVENTLTYADVAVYDALHRSGTQFLDMSNVARELASANAHKLEKLYLDIEGKLARVPLAAARKDEL